MSDAPSPSPLQVTTAEALLAHCRARFLTAIDNAAREIIRHPGWLEILRESAGECFDELSGDRERPGFEQAHGLTASRISLVHEEDLDYSIELINLDQRLRDHCERELAALHMRLKNLLSGTDAVLQEESPVGSESVCRALRALKESERLSAAEALQLLFQLEEPLKRSLCGFYRDLEQELAHAGIESRYRVRQPLNLNKPAESTFQRAPVGAAARKSTSVIQPLTRAVENEVLPHPVDALRLAVLARRESSAGLLGGGGNLDPSLAAALVERVEAWLSERHLSGEGAPVSLGGSEFGALLAPEKAAAVEVMEAIIAHGTADVGLPAAIKQILQQLRLPLLRLALRSTTLLGAERHPALKLVDLIASTGYTLAPDCAGDLPVCRGLSLVVRSLVQAPRLADKDFEAALASAEALLAARRRAAIVRAESYAEDAHRLERREVVLHLASRAIYLLVGHEAGAAARDFVEGFWVHVLAKVAYAYGTESPVWAARVKTANRVLVAAMPNPDEAARRALNAHLPALLKELEEGLAWIRLSEQQIRDGLAPCRELFGALLAGQPIPAPTRRRRPTLPSLGSVAEKPGLRVLKHKQYLAGELPLPPEWTGLEVGDSVAIGLPDGSVMRGFVALLCEARQVLLIADGDSETVLAVTARALAQQLSSPESRRFQPRSLVDEASIAKLLSP